MEPESIEIESLQVFQEIRNEIANDIYKDSPLLKMKQLSSRKKGSKIEALVQELAERGGKGASKPLSSGHDRIIDGKKIEIKGSFLWGDGSMGFKWQQIRPKQDYDEIYFVALYPCDIMIYKATKSEVAQHVEQQDENGNWIHNQHGGKKVNSGTFELWGFPENYDWMEKITHVKF